jgi:hypothetical protein
MDQKFADYVVVQRLGAGGMAKRLSGPGACDSGSVEKFFRGP